MALPQTLRGETLTEKTPAVSAKRAAARRGPAKLPAEAVGYGGSGAAPNRGSLASRKTKKYPGGWQPGTTIAGEYYLSEEHWLTDERFLIDNQWMFVDHVSRIPNSGDYFVFEFGRGESVIILRDKADEIRAFHNVCRHRGSRLCRHDADPTPEDNRLSVRQLGQTGNTPVFRCPYHAWTYDLDGSLVYAYGMQEDFDPANHGLIPCHLRTAEGNIFIHLKKDGSPPDFEQQVGNIRPVLQYYGTANLKVAARQTYPMYGNWKLALENFQECYHCGPAHTSLVTAHNWDGEMVPEQRAQRNAKVAEWVTREGKRRIRGRAGGMGGGGSQEEGEYETGMGGNLNPGFMTGSMDGKPVAPLLPNIKEWTYGTRIAGTRFYSFYAQCYDDHVGIARFTPRHAGLTDCELVWLVHPDAVEGRDYKPEDVMALWHVTIQEDIWIVENNHKGILSGSYKSGRYSDREGGPARFVEWYMDEVIGTV